MEHLNEGKPGINNVSDDKGKKNHKAGRVLGKEDRSDLWVPGWGLGVEVRGKIQGLL